MNGFEGIWTAGYLQRLGAALRRAWRRVGSAKARVGAAHDPVKDRALLKAALSTRLSPHLRKDVGAGEGD
jgi:hypothetical protein